MHCSTISANRINVHVTISWNLYNIEARDVVTKKLWLTTPHLYGMSIDNPLIGN